MSLDKIRVPLQRVSRIRDGQRETLLVEVAQSAGGVVVRHSTVLQDGLKRGSTIKSITRYRRLIILVILHELIIPIISRFSSFTAVPFISQPK